MYLLILFLFLPETVLSGPKCGGTFTATRGVLSTPNFPKKFSTPIHCQWLIDAHEASPNSSIIVYLTQLYVFEGLTFKEYTFYVDDYPGLEGNEIFKVSEDTINKVSFVRCHTHYLVITLSLNSLEGTHLRVLNNHLDVYGFNITYEIATLKSARENVCTMGKCGFTGNCYDHFTHFSCDCFPGYSGENCAEGPKSLCYTNGQPTCKNGGTCTHVGDSVVTCECRQGFTGKYCVMPISKLSQNRGCEDCLISCPFNGTLENVCKCGPTERPLNLNDSVGFQSTVIVVKSTNTDVSRPESREKMREYMMGLLKSESILVENIQILRSQAAGNAMTFRFVALKRDEKRIRNLINNWKRYGAIGNMSLVEKDIIMTTAPSLHLINVTVGNNSIRENGDILLSCEARGSPRMYFRWFKNGMLINATLDSSKNKWIKLIDGSTKGHYVAVLLIERASKLDEGEFTCQVEDYGLQQCRSINIVLKHPPSIWLEPKSLTVNKGQPFKLKCLSFHQRRAKYIYSWVKDNDLLRKNTDIEQYEILYPVGSVLQVSGLNRSTSYTCLVQDGDLPSKVSIAVNVIDRSRIIPCKNETINGFSWPETAPGTDYKQKCPTNFQGLSSRSCIMQESGKPVWQQPDFSNCTSLNLVRYIKSFQNINKGYIETTPLDVVTNFSAYLQNKTLLHGEGFAILDWIDKISTYNNFSQMSPVYNMSYMLLTIVDELLDQVNSLNKEQQVLLLQRMMRRSMIFLANDMGAETYNIYFKNIDVIFEDYKMPMNRLTYPQISFPGDGMYHYTKLIHIIYKNLPKFLPSKSIIRLSDDSDIEYEIISSVVGTWLTRNGRVLDVDSNYFATFSHANVQNKLEWDLKCAQAAYASSNYAWDTDVCKTKAHNYTTTICNCNRPGTLALLLVKEPMMLRNDASKPHDTIIIIGCSTCLLTSSICSVISLFNWIYHRSSFTFLKFQCCVSVSGTMVLFIVALCHELPKDYFLYIVSFLQCFFFMGMSSQLSTLLITYSELVEIRSKASIKLTVIGIITGAPLIVVFGSYLAHRTLYIHLSYWWLIKGTLSFNVFTSCTVIMLVLFMLIYFLVFKITHYDKSLTDKLTIKRLTLIRKTWLLFSSIIIFASVSIAYVNVEDDAIWRYAFCASSILMGLLVLICVLFNTNFFMKKQLMEKLKLRRTKTSENSTSPQKSYNSQEEMESAIDLQLAAPPSTKNSTDFSQSIEQYNASPTQFSAVSKSNSLNSPDILGTKVFVELDLVASSLQSASMIPISPIEPAKRSVTFETDKIAVAISKAFDEPLKIASQTITNNVGKFCDTNSVDVDIKVDSGHLDAVMDSISHDLNYLLNGCADFKDQQRNSSQHHNRNV